MEIVWSKKALSTAQEAADYARDQFGQGQVRKLREKIRSAMRKISTMPSSCPLEQTLLGLSPTYRYVTLFPNLELIFHEENDTCMIDIIWNTKRNPKTLAKNLD